MTVIAIPDPRPPAVAVAALLEPIAAAAQPMLPPFEPPAAPAVAGCSSPALAREAACRCRAILEAMAGVRPLAQAEAAATLDVVRTVARESRRRRRLSVRSVRVAEPRDGVVEVAVRAHDHDVRRDRALALRLERRAGLLVCTALDLGPPESTRAA